MALLLTMPPITIDKFELQAFGTQWNIGKALSRTSPYSSGDLGKVLDTAVAKSLAIMLGNISIIIPNANDLIPQRTDSVELGPTRIIGGVRPQNFDVGYRPDGVRFAFDSKTLNDLKSVGKNWQNMVNDLATEATTVHTRFPHAVVAFMVAIPTPCLIGSTRAAMVATLERLTGRNEVNDPAHMAEAISLVIWNPDTGEIEDSLPKASSPLRLELFSQQVERAYVNRYKGLPPHAE